MFKTIYHIKKLVIVQNVSKSHILLISLDQNVSILFVNILRVLGHFNAENHTWRLVIVQNLYEF